MKTGITSNVYHSQVLGEMPFAVFCLFFYEVTFFHF